LQITVKFRYLQIHTTPLEFYLCSVTLLGASYARFCQIVCGTVSSWCEIRRRHIVYISHDVTALCLTSVSGLDDGKWQLSTWVVPIL